MIFTVSSGGIGPYLLSMKDLYVSNGPEFRPKRHKLKGWQKAKRK
jgi:hypothetical protein